VPLRLAYLGVMNALAMLRLVPKSDGKKDAKILSLRHQITAPERQLSQKRLRFTACDRACLAALLHQLPPQVLRRMQLLVQPDTVRRWHCALVARRHAAHSRSKRGGLLPRRLHGQGAGRKFPAQFDTVLADARIEVVITRVRMAPHQWSDGCRLADANCWTGP
jgi:hypothetical protein